MNERISIDPQVCHGRPIIRGTRVPVARVLGYLAGGMSFEDTEKDFDFSSRRCACRNRLRKATRGSGTAPSFARLTERHAVLDRR